MARVELVDVEKMFDKVGVLKDINLTIEDKTFYTILGPSGSGKTTILKMIAGLEKPTKGKILINNEDVTNKTPKDRNVAMVFQNYALYPHMTVRQNLAFPLESRGMSKHEIERRVVDVAELLQIGTLLNKRPGQLSGGQAQRVSLGRAMVRNPAVFLMDEPLSNLDAKLRVYMRNELKKLQHELEATVIYVTHDHTEAMTLADNMALINFGKIFQTGHPTDVYNNPKNVTSAAFLGTPPMNFFNAKVHAVDIVRKITTLEVEGIMVSFGLPASDHIAVGDEILVGVRPENISVATNGRFSGIVGAEEILGRENIVHVMLNDSEHQFISREVFGVGNSIRFDFDTENSKMFDKKTGDIIG